MPTKRIYIDSRYRMPGGSDSDFRYALKTPIEVPRGTIGWIDGVVLSQSFGNIIAGLNDTLFVREITTAATTDRVVVLSAGDWNIYTLAAELQTKLNFGTTLPNLYTVLTSSGILEIQNPTPPGTGFAYILSLERVRANNLTPPWGSTTTPAPPPLSDTADACRVCGILIGLLPISLNTPFKTSYVDLMPYRQLFLHSHIGAPTSQGPQGENTIVRRIIIAGSPGDLITDFHNTQMDYIELGEQLSTLHFSLRDIDGNVVDTRGHPISFALCLS